MSPERSMLDVLGSIADIANDRRLEFGIKLNRILMAITECMQVNKSSIMLFKNSKTLEVVASTNPEIVGVQQSLDVDSPSSWVVKNKKPLYVDSSSQCDIAIKRFRHYKGDAFFLVPLINNNKVIGVINVTEKIGSDRFAAAERDILLHIMGHVIIALENHRLAESLQKKKKTLQKKNLELRKLEKLRTDLFNMLIHDLKGPISEIVANLDILSYTLTENENLAFVETAQAGCNTLFNMVSNLLDIARLEEGRLELMHEQIDPGGLIKDSLAGLLVSVKSRDLTFQEDFPETTGACTGDRSLLTRVLQNLLTNAIQYSPTGGTITVGYREIVTGAIEFFVEDEGPGIPEESREMIFNKYKQLDKKSDGRTYTTGLGLAFCKMAVEAHGGRITVECPETKGSRFFFLVPSKKKST